MIVLPEDHSDPLVVGVGHHRACYIHPQDHSKCIKVVHNPCEHATQEIQRELAYYRHLDGYLKDWRGLPKYYGEVETNLGKGYVYDRIVDFDGKPSETMQQRYTAQSLPSLSSEMEKLIADLKQYLWDNHIVTMSIKPYNILCHRISENEIFPVVCDNIGSAAFIPIEVYCPWFCHKKHQRLFKKFDKYMQDYLSTLRTGA